MKPYYLITRKELPFIGELHYFFALVSGISLGILLSFLLIITTKDQQYALKLSVSNLVGNSELVPRINISSTHQYNEIFHQFENRSITDQLTKTVRILCLVMTSPKNHVKKAKHIKETWGKRCNVLLFISSKNDNNLPSINLSVKEGRKYLWTKTKESFRYVYHYHMKDADWFLKVDDETYVILENLRYLLYSHDPLQPIYFGCRYKSFVKQGFMSGNAGYVLSKEAVRRLVERALPNPKQCRQTDTEQEDVEMGKCLESVNVIAGDSRDLFGRSRFLPLKPENHLIPGPVDPKLSYWKLNFYENKQGMDCCSDNAISFHYISPKTMYLFEYLLYHLHPYGIESKVEPFVNNNSMSKIH